MYKDIASFWYRDVPYPVSENDCLGTIKLLHAFYRSDEEGAWVEVDSDKESKRLGRPDETLASLYRTPKKGWTLPPSCVATDTITRTVLNSEGEGINGKA